MTEYKRPDLRIVSEFKQLCLPLSEQEYVQLEQELISSNSIVEIKAWNRIVLYDYEKLEICQKHCIPYVSSKIYIPNNTEALLWLCKRQLECDDLPVEMRRYLIGKRYSFEKVIAAHKKSLLKGNGKLRKYESGYEDCAARVGERLGKEYNVVLMTIRKYCQFADSLDIIYSVSEKFAVNIKQGVIKLSQEGVIALSKKSKKEIMRVSEQLLKTSKVFETFAGSRKALAQIMPATSEITVKEKEISIKDMPEYDPDSEVASLALTIPSWISSINRVRNVSNLNVVSSHAKKRLFDELEQLSGTIFYMLEMLREE